MKKRQPVLGLIQTESVKPECERWLHEPPVSDRLTQALAWAQANQAHSDNADAILAKLTNAD